MWPLETTTLDGYSRWALIQNIFCTIVTLCLWTGCVGSWHNPKVHAPVCLPLPRSLQHIYPNQQGGSCAFVFGSLADHVSSCALENLFIQRRVCTSYGTASMRLAKGCVPLSTHPKLCRHIAHPTPLPALTTTSHPWHSDGAVLAKGEETAIFLGEGGYVQTWYVTGRH